MSTSTITDRVRKLLALAADASAGEAETAAAMAARLMAEHGVTLADVAASTERQRPAVGVRHIAVTAAMWEAYLLAVVARACGGDAVLVRDPARAVLIYAPEALVDGVVDLASYVRLQIVAAAAAEARTVIVPSVRAWKRSFILGAIDRVGERLRAQRQAVAAESISAGTALARLSDDVRLALEAKHPKRRQRGVTFTTAAGIGHGRAAADRMDLGGSKLHGGGRQLAGGAP